MKLEEKKGNKLKRNKNLVRSNKKAARKKNYNLFFFPNVKLEEVRRLF